MTTFKNSNTNQGLTITAYSGANNMLLGFNLDESKLTGFAGFALQITPPNGAPFWFKNRLSFNTPVHSELTPQQQVDAQTESNQAPI